ncbi:MAG: sugar phosphate isomerase/epimerase [Chloroflexi bacterium]|nr:sugar phosphate isomerase/epimerase [Chloroflexota bacterium]
MADLGFRSVDLLALSPRGQWVHIKPHEVVADPDRVAATVSGQLAARGLRAAGMNVQARVKDLDERGVLAAQCRLAACLGLASITVQATFDRLIPSRAPADLIREGWLEREKERFGRLLAAAGEVTLSVETHSFSIMQYPEMALGLLDAWPALRVSLDPTHFVVWGLREPDFRPLYPRVDHLHLRDSGSSWAENQVPAGQGLVNGPEVLEHLLEQGFQGTITLEYVDSLGPGDPPFDVVPETAKLKAQVEEVLARWRGC